MNKEVRQLLIMVGLVFGALGTLWIGAKISSADIEIRNICYKAGVDGLPQGMDQTFLQTQSKAYKDCLVSRK